MPNLKLGVICRTRKENERGCRSTPHHFDRIDADLRSNIYLEHGYGEDFGVSATPAFGLLGGDALTRALIAECDVILLTQAGLPRISPNFATARCCGVGRTASRIAN